MTQHQLKVASSFVKHVECPKCGSSDANSLYSDGHMYCFQCHTYSMGDIDDTPTVKPNKSTQMSLKLPNTADVRAIQDRNITRETCTYYNVLQATGQHFYPYTDEDGKLLRINNVM